MATLTELEGSEGPSPRADTARPGAAAPAASMLERLGEAIDELAEALCSQEACGISANDVARIWALVAALDPAVAARLPGYYWSG